MALKRFFQGFRSLRIPILFLNAGTLTMYRSIDIAVIANFEVQNKFNTVMTETKQLMRPFTKFRSIWKII